MSQIIEQRIATVLGNFGLLPFFALAAAAWLPLGPDNARVERLIDLALIAYAAVILSFLSAVHWGLVLLTPQLNKTHSWHALGWSVVGPILGWLALLLAFGGMHLGVVYVVLMSDFVLARLADSALLPRIGNVPTWYPALRTRLTIGVIAALALALASTL